MMMFRRVKRDEWRGDGERFEGWWRMKYDGDARVMRDGGRVDGELLEE